MIKAIFFDIDGTLVPFGKKTMPQSTYQALTELRKQGIKLFVATGRTPNDIAHVQAMFHFDGYLTANGQYCFNDHGLIYEKYIPQESFKQLIPYLEEQHIPIVCALLNQSYRNYPNSTNFDNHWPLIDLHHLENQRIIQIMAYIPEEQDKLFLKHLPHCKAVRWSPDFADIISEDSGKDRGIDHILAAYDIPLEHTMAFGDGGNDMTMLKHVSYSVAMGNACQEVKQCASYVTANAEDDGIYLALKHFHLLPTKN